MNPLARNIVSYHCGHIRSSSRAMEQWSALASRRAQPADAGWQRWAAQGLADGVADNDSDPEALPLQGGGGANKGGDATATAQLVERPPPNSDGKPLSALCAGVRHCDKPLSESQPAPFTDGPWRLRRASVSWKMPPRRWGGLGA